MSPKLAYFRPFSKSGLSDCWNFIGGLRFCNNLKFSLDSRYMKTLFNLAAVGLGGALGSMLRYCITLVFCTLHLSGNIATFTVNLVGSFAIGYLSGSFKGETLALMLTVGLCGGFTTFSTFSMQSVRLFQNGNLWQLILYISASNILCILSAALGWWLSGASR